MFITTLLFRMKKKVNLHTRLYRALPMKIKIFHSMRHYKTLAALVKVKQEGKTVNLVKICIYVRTTYFTQIACKK